MNIFTETVATKQSVNQRKLLYGLGINDAGYNVSYRVNGKRVVCPFYNTWRAMFVRCYSENCHERQPTYKGCSVSESWHNFMTFKLWMQSQDWQDNQLDKDIISVGNKIYSPENCVFVTREINSLLANRYSARGKLPKGVVFDRQRNKFKAKCRINGIQKTLGRYLTAEQAHIAYIKFKANHIASIASKQEDIRLKNGLLLHSAALLAMI